MAYRAVRPVFKTLTDSLPSDPDYTVPDGWKTILRSIRFANHDAAGAHAVTMKIISGATTLTVFAAENVPASGELEWGGFMVLYAGDTIKVYADHVTAVDCIVSGVEVSSA